jgi:hypothetical protein
MNLVAYRSIGCRRDALVMRQSDGVVRGSRRALRRTGPRPPEPRGHGLAQQRGHGHTSRALRADLAPPVRSIAPRRSRCARERAAWEPRDGRADASLEVLIPFSACQPRRAYAGRCHLAGCPASTLAGVARPPSPFQRRATDGSPAGRATPCAPTHRRDACSFLRFSLALGEANRAIVRGSLPRVGETGSLCRLDAHCFIFIHCAPSPPWVMRHPLLSGWRSATH